ncbi:radical SAM protein [Candidatus Parcubacteria bacterium]|nr:MAG: radical SAM protein [Candidatus Parcubacteria bacterium]
MNEYKFNNLVGYIRGLKYLRRAVLKKSGTPLYLIFFITSKCNLRCKHCFYWKELNKEEKFLSLEEIQKISLSMEDLPYLRLTGGEPSLRPDFPQIAEIFYKNNNLINLGINTNGFFTEKIIAGVQQILEKCPDLNVDVCVSLDDTRKGHDNNRGVAGTYDNAVNTLLKLNKLREIYPKMKTVIGLDLNKSNQDRLALIFEEIKALDVSYICDTVVRGDPKEPAIKDVKMSNYKTLNDLVGSYNIKRQHHAYFNINAKDKMVEEAVLKARVENKWWGFNCTAGVNAGVIYADGAVFPCEGRNEKIGNIRDYNYDFKELWNSEENQKIRETIKKGRCHCTHENFITASIFSSPYALIKLLFKAFRDN